MRNLGKILLYVLILAGLGGLIYLSFTQTSTPSQNPDRPGRRGGAAGARGGEGGRPIPDVLVAKVDASDVPVYVEAIATVKAPNTVAIRPQVSGQLIAVNFREGQFVKKGDVLANIDPSTYQANLDQSLAKKKQDAAQLDNARRDLDRYVRLAQTNAAPAQQADTQRALVAQYEAQLQADDAAIENARVQFSFTSIIAPIDGLAGLRNVDPGNLMAANDANAIVTLAQMQPISVVMSVPQQDLANIRKAQARGAVQVDVLSPRGDEKIEQGVLDVIDNQIDSTTGTVKIKATMLNPNLQLWPGAFINARILVNVLHQASTIPSAALQRGPQGAFVYVETNGMVEVRPVTLVMQGNVQAVVSEGLKLGERVVTTGFTQLSNGTKVTVADPLKLQKKEGSADALGEGPAAAKPDDGAPAQAGADQSQDQGKGHGKGKRKRDGQGQENSHQSDKSASSSGAQ